MAKKSSYTGKYAVDSPVIVNDGGNYASNKGMVTEVKPEKPSHNYRVIFDVFSGGIWFSEDELDEPTPKPAKPSQPDYTFEFGIGGAGAADDPYYDMMTALPTRPIPQSEMVECDCGHTVPRSWRMNASAGTACPDCYDRMSE